MEVKLASTTSVFGAALASLLVAPELQADVVSLTFNPSTNLWSALGGTYVHINEVGASFFQFNDLLSREMFAVGLSSITVVRISSTLSPKTFTGVAGVNFSAASSGTQYVGFRLGGNVGWFSFSVAGPMTDIRYLEGGYGNAGEDVHVGTVPSPGALALLALGAVGLRRKRKRAA